MTFNMLNNNAFADDARSGKEVWKSNEGVINLSEPITITLLFFENNVFVGNAYVANS